MFFEMTITEKRQLMFVSLYLALKVALQISDYDKAIIKKELAKYKLPTNQDRPNKYTKSFAVVYFIPGIGKVALVATGVVVGGYVLYEVGSYMYSKIMDSIAKELGIPKKLLKDGRVDLDGVENFNNKQNNKNETPCYKIPGTRYYIVKDRAAGKSSAHGGSHWKLKKGSCNSRVVIATLRIDGSIIKGK